MKRYRIYLDVNSRKATHIVDTISEVKEVFMHNVPTDGKSLPTSLYSFVVDEYNGKRKSESYLAQIYLGELSLNPCYSEAYTRSNF